MMSQAFTREPDGGMGDESLPDRPVSAHPNYVTPGGLRQLEGHIGALEERRLDLLAREGEDEPMANEELALVDRDLRYYSQRLQSAILIDLAKQPRRKVAFGAAVTVTDEDGTQRTFRIVGEDEADLEESKISYLSPLAVALLGARVGAKVLWHRPAGNRKLKIEAIEYPDE
jgi:transcription elongation factor GreB